MKPDINYYQLAFYVASGVILASWLLFYSRRFAVAARYHLLAAGLSIASLVYVVFALISLNTIWITVEVVGLLLFLMFVWLAYQYSFWFVALGWLLHIVWDVGIHGMETAPYVPQWYAWLCVGFDGIVACYLMLLLIRHSEQSPPAT